MTLPSKTIIYTPEQRERLLRERFVLGKSVVDAAKVTGIKLSYAKHLIDEAALKYKSTVAIVIRKLKSGTMLTEKEINDANDYIRWLGW